MVWNPLLPTFSLVNEPVSKNDPPSASKSPSGPTYGGFAVGLTAGDASCFSGFCVLKPVMAYVVATLPAFGPEGASGTGVTLRPGTSELRISNCMPEIPPLSGPAGVPVAWAITATLKIVGSAVGVTTSFAVRIAAA